MEEINNIEENEPKSEVSTEVESEENNDWLNKSYEITLLFRKFKIKDQEINVIINTDASTNIIIKILLDKLSIKIQSTLYKCTLHKCTHYVHPLQML